MLVCVYRIVSFHAGTRFFHYIPDILMQVSILSLVVPSLKRVPASPPTRSITNFSLSFHHAFTRPGSLAWSLYFARIPSACQYSRQEQPLNQCTATRGIGQVGAFQSLSSTYELVAVSPYQRALVHLLFRCSTMVDHSQSAIASPFHTTSKEIRWIGDYPTSNTQGTHPSTALS